MIKGSQQRRTGGGIGRHNIFFLISLFINIFLGYKLWTTSALKELSDQQFDRAEAQMNDMNQKQQTAWKELNEKKVELQKQKTELEKATNAAQGCYQKLTAEERFKEDSAATLKACNDEKTDCNAQLTSRNQQVQTSADEFDKCNLNLEGRSAELSACMQEKNNYMAEVERLKVETDGKIVVRDVEANKEVAQQPGTVKTKGDESPKNMDDVSEGGATEGKSNVDQNDDDAVPLITCSFGGEVTHQCTGTDHNGGDGMHEWRLGSSSKYSPYDKDSFAVFDSDDVSDGDKGNMAKLKFGPIKVEGCVEASVTYHIVGKVAMLAKLKDEVLYNDFAPTNEWTTVNFNFIGTGEDQMVELVVSVMSGESAVGVSKVAFVQKECDAYDGVIKHPNESKEKEVPK